MKISTQLWIGLIVGAVIVFFLVRGCKNNPDTVQPPDTQGSLDSLAIVKRADSIRLVWQRDSLQMVQEMAEEELKRLSAALDGSGRTILQQSRLIAALRKDTGRTVYEETCDSLAILAPMYVHLSDSFRTINNEQAIRFEAERQVWRETDSLTNVAYLSAVDIAVQSAESYNQYRAQNKPRNEVYIGLNGQSNLIWSAGGPEIMFKDKRDRIIKASILFGNTKPIYQVGTAVKIKLRR